jgi:peroxiredoxin-like protein
VPEGGRRRSHAFAVRGRWSRERGQGEVELGGDQATTISVPEVFGGSHPGTNPEELLLASAVACYLMTLGRVLTRRGLEADVEARAEGEVSRGPDGLRFERIRLEPRVRGVPPERRAEVLDALHEAEGACFIARTLRPVIPYALEPVFVD